MIKIEHIKAHLPSKNCQLTFMIRRKQRNLQQKKQSKVKLTQDYVDIDVHAVIQLGQFINYTQPIQLCVIAVTQTDKICVGSIQVNIKDNINSKTAILDGIIDQDGYIVYSLVRDKKMQSTRSLQQNYSNNQSNSKKDSAQAKVSASRGFIKYKNSSSSSSFNDNQQSLQSKSGSQSPFKKNKLPQNIQAKSDQYNNLLDQIYHQILEEQLYNQRIWNRIQENQIFQLRYKQRIQALIGDSFSSQ